MPTPATRYIDGCAVTTTDQGSVLQNTTITCKDGTASYTQSIEQLELRNPPQTHILTITPASFNEERAGRPLLYVETSKLKDFRFGCIQVPKTPAEEEIASGMLTDSVADARKIEQGRIQAFAKEHPHVTKAVEDAFPHSRIVSLRSMNLAGSELVTFDHVLSPPAPPSDICKAPASLPTRRHPAPIVRHHP